MNISKARVWLFAIFGIGLAVSISLAEIATVLLLIDAILRRGSEGAPEPSPLEIPILAAVVWGVAVTLVAGSTSIIQSFASQSALVLFFLAVRVWSNDDNERWMRWFVIGGIVSGIFALIQVGLHIDRYPVQDQLIVPPWLQHVPERILRFLALRNERAVGTRSHPLTFGEGVLGAFVLLLAAPLWTSDRWKRFRWISLFLLAAGILVSQGRGVWLGAFGAAFVLGWFWRKRRDVRLAMGVGFVIALVALMAVPKIRARAMSIVAPTGGQAADQASRSTRFDIWSAALESIKQHPVMGVGIRGVALQVVDPVLGVSRPWSETHNIFLQVTTERGLIGFGLFSWILVLAFMASFRAPAGWRELGVAFLAALLIAGLTESWTNDKEIAMIFWVVLGALERRRLTREEPE